MEHHFFKALTLALILPSVLLAANSVEVDSEVRIYSQLDALTIGKSKWNKVPLRKVLREIVAGAAEGYELGFKLSEELEKTKINLELPSQTLASALCRICKHTRSEWLIDSGDIIIRPKNKFTGSQPNMLVEAFTVTRAMVIRPTPSPYRQSGSVDPFASRNPALWYQEFTSFDKVRKSAVRHQKPQHFEKK
jgi:hypothetical protein